MTTLKRYTGTQWETVGLPNNVGMSPQTLGYAEVLTNQTGISALVDLTGLSVNVTVPAGRRIRITGQIQLVSASTSGTCAMYIREGTTTLQTSQENYNTIGGNGKYVDGSVIISPTAGTHTYKLSASGTAGTVDLIVGATTPAFILVEDITGSTLPYQPSSVPVGRLAYAQVTASQSGLGTSAVLTGLSVNVSVPAGRVLRITASGQFTNSTVGAHHRLDIREGATILNTRHQSNAQVTQYEGIFTQAIISPSAGAHTYFAQYVASASSGGLFADPDQPAFIMVEDITPTPAASSGAPGSTLGYAERITDQTGISSITDITGLSATVTVPAGRRIRVRGYAHFLQQTSSGISQLFIREGSTTLQTAVSSAQSPSQHGPAEVEWVGSPSEGTHTYKLSALTTGGTLDIKATATDIAFILVEDITGSVWPQGSSVTAGMVANESWNSFVPVVTQGGGPIANTVTYSKYLRMGKTVMFNFRLDMTAAGSAGTAIKVSLPFATSGLFYVVGNGWVYDLSANLMYSGGWTTDGTNVYIHTDGFAGGAWGINPSIGLASGDLLSGSCVYEAAT